MYEEALAHVQVILDVRHSRIVQSVAQPCCEAFRDSTESWSSVFQKAPAPKKQKIKTKQKLRSELNFDFLESLHPH